MSIRYLNRLFGGRAVLAGLLLVLGAGASGATSTASGAAASSPVALPAAPVAAAVSSAQQARIAERYGQLPISFEANRGQTDAQVRFLSRGAGYALFLTDSEAVMSLSAGSEKNESSESKAGASARTADASPPKTAVLRWQLLGANPAAKVSGEAPQAGRSHYFTGNDPKQWRTDVEHYAQVRYQNVYPGIDLVYHGQQQQLEYDFIVAPQADPAAIRMRYSGQQGLRLNQAGDLVISSTVGDLVQRKPVIYQTLGGERKTIDGRFELRQQGEHTEVAFALADYDRSQALVIDPVLAYSTYLGGNGDDVGYGIAVDSAGKAYVTGATISTNFPLANALQGALSGDGDYDAFVTQLNADGSDLVYSTYLGGSDNEGGTGIAVDSAGKAYVAGYTSSTNFPLANALQSTHGGDYDAFVTQLNADGSALVYSTYLGGSNKEEGNDIAVDSAGKAYVTGQTDSTNFPLANALQGIHGGDDDAFVAQLNADGSDLVYSTYLGGSATDVGHAIAVDSAGKAYVTGATISTNFPLANALQGIHGGDDDAFVTQLNADGSALVYSTYLGGAIDDYGDAIAVDGAGKAYVTGYTGSTNFPLANALQGTFGGIYDAFVAQLNADGSALVYSTYLGGSATDVGTGIAVDSAGKAYVTGYTISTNFPLANALQGTFGGIYDAFVTQLSADGSALVYSTYLGGSSIDYVHDIAVDSAGKAYVTGATISTNFPLANALQGTLGGGYDAFVARITNAGQIVFGTPGSYEVGEAAGVFQVPVVRIGGDVGAVSVTVTTANGSATAPGDYTAVSAVVNFDDGTSGTLYVDIPIINDALDEADETVQLTLSNPTGGATLGQSSGTLTIIDDDEPPPVPQPGTLALSSAAVSVAEDVGSATLTVRRTGGSDGAVGVALATADGSAQAGADYTATTMLLSWADGDAADKTVSIPVLDDAADEADETVMVTLGEIAGGAELGLASATLTIVDDDEMAPEPQPGALSFSSAVVDAIENAGTITLTVRRSGGSEGAASATVATADGSARAGSDYAAAAATVNWADGDAADKTVNILILDDADDETAEVFTAALSAASGAALGAPAVLTVTIDDDDDPTPVQEGELTKGGGAMGGGVLLLGLLAALRRRRLMPRTLMLLAALGFAPTLSAAEFYVGAQGGAISASLDSQSLTRTLQSAGYEVVADLDDDDSGWGVYGGWYLHPRIALELAYRDLGEYSARVSGDLSDGQGLVEAAADGFPGGGDTLSAAIRMDVPLYGRLSLRPSLGVFVWDTEIALQTEDGRYETGSDGAGLLAGLGLDLRLGAGLSVGAGIDLLRPGHEGAQQALYGRLEWRFGR